MDQASLKGHLRRQMQRLLSQRSRRWEEDELSAIAHNIASLLGSEGAAANGSADEPSPLPAQSDAQPPPQAAETRDKEPPQWLRYGRRLGYGSLLLGVARLIPSSYFWFQIGAVAAAVLFFAIDACFETWPAKYKASVITALVLALVGYLYIVGVFTSPKLNLQAYTPPNAYQSQTEIGGISWDEHYTDLRISIGNRSDQEYLHYEALLMPDRYVYRASILDDQGNGCRLTPAGTRIFYTAKEPIKTSSNQTFTVRRAGDSGDVYDSEGNAYIPMAYEDGFRLRCPSIPPHSVVRLVLALISLSKAESNGLINEPPKNGPPGGFGLSVSALKGTRDWHDLLDPKPTTNSVYVNYSYAVGQIQRPYSAKKNLMIAH